MIFLHANRYQWHNDDPLYDGSRVLERLSVPTIKREGYVNLRCVWTIGCRVEIRPLEEAGSFLQHADLTSAEPKAGTFYQEAFQQLFPDTLIPQEIGAPCCAQFAVSALQIRRRPRSDYERYRRWLLETPLRDDLSGRIMEYSWHSEWEGILEPSRRTIAADHNLESSNFREKSSTLSRCPTVLLRPVQALSTRL